jgi:hypothetical protein
MSDGLEDIIEELTHQNDLCQQCGLPHNECNGHKLLYDDDDWVCRERNRKVPKELSCNQYRARASLQLKRKELRALIHQLKPGENFMFDKDMPSYEGSSIKWEHSSEPAVFNSIDDTVVKYQLCSNPTTKDGRPKYRFMDLKRFAKYFKKIIGTTNDCISKLEGGKENC